MEELSLETQYSIYMLNVHKQIVKINHDIEMLPKYEQMSKLSFEEWCKLNKKHETK